MYAWQSVEEAAVTLGISARTLHRRISKGEVETRLENGRREILVCLPDPEPQQVVSSAPEVEVEVQDGREQECPPAQSGQSAFDHTAIILAQKEVALVHEKMRRTEVAMAAFQHASHVLQRDASRSRMSARLAWAAVALLSAGVYIAVGWTASQVTKAKTQNEHLSNQLSNVTAVAQEKSAEADKLRGELTRYQQSAARAEGELEVTRATLAAAKKAATQPSTFFDKLARLAGD